MMLYVFWIFLLLLQEVMICNLLRHELKSLLHISLPLRFLPYKLGLLSISVIYKVFKVSNSSCMQKVPKSAAASHRLILSKIIQTCH